MHDGSCCNDTVVEMIHTEALEVFCAEMLQKLLPCRLIGEHPVVHFESTEACSELLFKVILPRSVIKDLLWGEVSDKFFHIIERSFTCKELTSGDVKEADTTRSLTKMHSCEKVVLLVIQHAVAHCHTRCYEFGNAPTHHLILSREPFLTLQLLTLLLRVFQLVANGHPLSGPDEFRQESI